MWLLSSTDCKRSEDLTPQRGGDLHFSSISWSCTPWEVRYWNDHPINDQCKYEFMCLQIEVKSFKVRVRLEGKFLLLRQRLFVSLPTSPEIKAPVTTVYLLANCVWFNDFSWKWLWLHQDAGHLPKPSLCKTHIQCLEPEDEPSNTGIDPFSLPCIFPFCAEFMG